MTRPKTKLGRKPLPPEERERRRLERHRRYDVFKRKKSRAHRGAEERQASEADAEFVQKEKIRRQEHEERLAALGVTADVPVDPDEIRRRAQIMHNANRRTNKLTADQEFASRVLSRRRLLPFVQRFFPDYQAGWVHQDICRRLERFLHAVELKESPRLLLLMPPRTGKSTLASRFFPAWVLGHHPEWELIAASHSQPLAMSFSRQIRELLRDPRYTSLFQHTRLDPNSQAIENWMTTAYGGYLAAGVGTGITGRGANVLLVDDPVKDMEAADSATIRDATWLWYGSTAFTRLAPGGGVLGIMTHWNDDDWAGRIILASESGEGEKFEIVRYAAINEGYDEYLQNERDIIQVAPGMAAPEGAELLRPASTALHPERYTLEYLQRIRQNFYATGQQRVWSALYQQNPVPEEGAFFTKDMLHYYSAKPERHNCHVYQAWDFAITTKQTSDWTVCSTMMQDEYDTLSELSLVRFRTDNAFIIVDSILDQFAQWRPDLLGFEDGQIWKSIKDLFIRRCHERNLYPSYEVLVPLTDKMVRAGPLRGRMQMRKVQFDANAEYRRVADLEMLRFPAGKNDDIIDARAWCVRLALLRAAPRRAAQPKPPPSWRDRLGLSADSDGTTHMAA